MVIGKRGFRKRYAVLWILGATLLIQGQQPPISIGSIESLIRAQNYDAALEATRTALHEKPTDFRVWTLQGIVLSLKGNNDHAFEAFEKALSLSPNYPAALKGEVQLLYQSQDKRAIPLLERILKTDQRDETAHEMLAILEARQGNCRDANQHFLLSQPGFATHPDALEAYGACLVETNQPEKAIPIFQQLAAVLPQRTYPKYDLAVVLVKNKQDEAAIKVLEPLLAADQSDPDVLSLASEVYEAAGKTPMAVSLLRQAIVLKPENADYYNAFALLCLDHDSFQVGIDMIDAGLQRIPEASSLYLSRGLLFAQLAQYDKAEADFKNAEHFDSTQTLSSYALDLAELQKNQSGKTITEIRSQLKAHPDSPLLQYLLAKLLATQESETDIKVSAEAMHAALLAVKLKPDLVEARDLLASMYMTSGQYDLAINQCRLALQYTPSDRSAMYHLIIALRHSKQSGQSNEIDGLVKRLSDLQQASLQQETARKRFRLVEQESEPAK